VQRCVVHYVTPNLKVIPFCAYNNIHRIGTEEKYATQQHSDLSRDQVS
jgi:hypothetical protein